MCAQCTALVHRNPLQSATPSPYRPVIASLEVFGGCEVDMVLATLIDPEPNAEPAPAQVSSSVTVSTGVDLQEGVLSGCNERTSSAARQQTVSVVSSVFTNSWCWARGVHNLTLLSAVSCCLHCEQVPGPLPLLKDELMEFECSVSPVPSPPPSLQLETTAEMRCQQSSAKCGSSTNGAVATAMVVEGTGLLGEALDDADFGFSRKLSHEATASQHSELASALFGDDSLPEDVGEGLSGGGVDDDITDSMVIPGTPQAKRVSGCVREWVGVSLCVARGWVGVSLVCWHVHVAEGNNCCVCSLQHKPSLLWEGGSAAPDWDSSTPPPASPLPRVLAPDSDPEEEEESL